MSTKDRVTATPNSDVSEEELVTVAEMVATSAPAENIVTATPKANSAASVADIVITRVNFNCYVSAHEISKDLLSAKLKYMN